MKTIFAALLLVSTGLAAHAESYFCEPQAEEAVVALSDVNGTVNEYVFVVSSPDGKTFEVMAKEAGIGQDLYEVVTTGGHDCLVTEVKAKGLPTKRP